MMLIVRAQKVMMIDLHPAEDVIFA